MREEADKIHQMLITGEEHRGLTCGGSGETERTGLWENHAVLQRTTGRDLAVGHVLGHSECTPSTEFVPFSKDRSRTQINSKA